MNKISHWLIRHQNVLVDLIVRMNHFIEFNRINSLENRIEYDLINRVNSKSALRFSVQIKTLHYKSRLISDIFTLLSNYT